METVCTVFFTFFLTKETIQSFTTVQKKRIQESKEVTVEGEQNLDSKQEVSSVDVKKREENQENNCRKPRE